MMNIQISPVSVTMQYKVPFRLSIARLITIKLYAATKKIERALRL